MNKTTHHWARGILKLGLLCGALAGAPLFAQEPAHQNHVVPAKLVQDVREVTQKFLDVNNAGPSGYEPAFGCVTGPDHGAMGIHYVNMDFVKDGEIYLEYPEP